MYVIAIHDITNEVAFERGQALMHGVGAPDATRVLQFYPAQDGSRVICLWESTAVDAVQAYVDETLGDSSLNTCFPINAEQSFAERPLGLSPAPALAQ